MKNSQEPPMTPMNLSEVTAKLDQLLLPDVVTAERLAKYLGVSLESVLMAIDAGEIPARPLLGTWLIDSEAFRSSLR